MGSLFSSPAPKPLPPQKPVAPVEEATFQPGGDDEGRENLKKRAMGKKKLQIPLTKAGAKPAVNTGR